VINVDIGLLVTGAISVVLLGYLLVALLYPERFD
jgi:K+-transporting ATPase KdpF subunit